MDPKQQLAHARLWLFVLAAYGFLLAATVGNVGKSSLHYWWSGAAGAAIAVAVVRTMGFPLRFYGLTLSHSLTAWRSSLYATLCSTGLLILLGLVALLWLFPQAAWTAPRFEWELMAYVVLSAPMQEFVFRGVFQNSARYIFSGHPHVTPLAIGFSTLAYAASHLPWGIPVALLAIIPGLVWGVQLERTRDLGGVMLSHATVGWFFVGATPLWESLAGR